MTGRRSPFWIVAEVAGQPYLRASAQDLENSRAGALTVQQATLFRSHPHQGVPSVPERPDRQIKWTDSIRDRLVVHPAEARRRMAGAPCTQDCAT